MPKENPPIFNIFERKKRSRYGHGGSYTLGFLQRFSNTLGFTASRGPSPGTPQKSGLLGLITFLKTADEIKSQDENSA